jgi:hypothetical protein
MQVDHYLLNHLFWQHIVNIDTDHVLDLITYFSLIYRLLGKLLHLLLDLLLRY